MRKAAALAKQEGRDTFEILPLPLYSFADLKKRVEIQEETRKEDEKHLRHLKEMVSQIVNKQGQLMKELKARANTHIDLARRVMRIYRKQGLREFDSAKDQVCEFMCFFFAFALLTCLVFLFACLVVSVFACLCTYFRI